MPILYKYSKFLSQSDDPRFDKIYHPDTATPHSGIYRCTNCGQEAASITGHTLPPQNHHQHSSNAPIQWQLVVWGDMVMTDARGTIRVTLTSGFYVSGRGQKDARKNAPQVLQTIAPLAKRLGTLAALAPARLPNRQILVPFAQES